MKRLLVIFVAFFALGLLLRLSLFTVDEGHYALVLGWDGELSSVKTKPGIQVKLPDPVERVLMLDGRGQLLPVSAGEPKEGSDAPVFSFDVVWRVNDPVLWWKSFGDDAAPAREAIAREVGEASSAVVAGIGDPRAVRLAGDWVASRVKEAAGDKLRSMGIALDSVRSCGARLGDKGLKKALTATSRAWSGGISASDDEEKADATAIRRAADNKASVRISSAVANARAVREAADREAARLYGRLDKTPGLEGLSARIAEGRSESRRSGKAAPVPESLGAAAQGRP